MSVHEVALATELVETMLRAAREHGAGRIVGADLEVGALTAVVPDALGFAFEVCSRGTAAEGCQLRIRNVPLVVACPACAFEGEVTEPHGCPTCGALGLRVLQGREFRLVAIDALDPTEPPGRPQPCT